MRYARHRFVLLVLLAILPATVGLALVQTPEVSDLVLRFALRVARFRTGLKIDAKAWTVNPFAFSAGLDQVEVQLKDLRATCARLEVQISPVALALGQLHLRDVVVEQPTVSGRIDPRWLEDNEPDDPNKDVPTTLGRKIDEAIAQLRARHLSVDEFTLLGARIETDLLRLEAADLHLTNLEGGQVSLEWELGGLSLPGKLPRLESFRGSLSLLKSLRREFYMVLPTVELTLLPAVASSLQINGRWPGDARLSGEVALAPLREWLGGAESLRTKMPAKLEGTLKLDLNLALQGNGLKQVGGKLSARGFRYNDYVLNDWDLRGGGNSKDVTIEELKWHLPFAAGDTKGWKNLIVGRNLRYTDGQVQGRLDFDQAGLCGVLKATSVLSCHTSLAATGAIPFRGTLKPLLIQATPDLQAVESRVASGQFVTGSAQENLLTLNPHKLVGDVEVNDQRVDLRNVRLEWPDGSKLGTTGHIDYNPTVVDLTSETTPNSRLDKMFGTFLDLRLQGKANLGGRVTFNEKIPVERGKTQVVARANVMDIGVEGQNFGTLVGPVTFSKDTLRFGPFRLVSGGGRATVDGSLKIFEGNHPSFLSVGSVMDRLELSAVMPESKSEIFRGFVSGTAQIQGTTDKTSPDFMSGPMNLKIDTFRVFGVPFQKSTVKARYVQTVLEIQNMQAQRDKSVVSMHGKLHPVGGSELLFESSPFPIRELGLDPRLVVAQRGNVEIKGYWRPAQGWGLRGRTSELRIAGQDLPNGDVELSGTATSFLAKARLPQTLEFDYEERGAAKMSPTRLSCRLHDEGFYAVFAYLKGWTSASPVRTRGDLDLNWTPHEGRLELSDLRIDGPRGAELNMQNILSFQGRRTLAWRENKILQNTLSWDGPTSLRTDGVVGAGVASLDMNVPLPLLDLFVPNLRFQDGTLRMTARMPMAPDLRTMEASGTLQNGSILIRGLGQPIKSTSARLELASQRLSIADGRGNLGSGSIAVAGVYNLDPRRPGLSLQMSLNRANLVVMDDVPTDVTGVVTLKGEDAPYHLSGRVQVSNALYAKEFKRDTALVGTATEPLLKFGLDVELGSNVRVRNTLTSSLLGGRLLVSGTDIEPNVQGAVNIESGSVYANETEFKVSQGNVAFPGGVAPPFIGLQANTVIKYNAQDYKVEMRARGPVDNLDIEFTSDPSLATPDIVNLLAFGVIRAGTDESTSTENTDLVNAARMEAFQALFGTAIGKGLDKSTGFQVRFKATPDLSQKELVPKVTVMRKLTDRVTATFGQSLSKSEQNVEVDYRLLNNVNLTGVWESQETGVSQKDSAFGADLRFRFDIK